MPEECSDQQAETVHRGRKRAPERSTRAPTTCEDLKAPSLPQGRQLSPTALWASAISGSPRPLIPDIASTVPDADPTTTGSASTWQGSYASWRQPWWCTHQREKDPCVQEPATRAATTGENPLEKPDNTRPPPPLLVKPTLPATTDSSAIPGLRDCFQKTVSPESPLDQNLCNAVQPSGLNVIHRDDEGSEPDLFDASIISKVPRTDVVATQRRQTWRSQHQPPPDTIMESRTTSRRSRCSGQPHQRSLAHQLSPRGAVFADHPTLQHRLHVVTAHHRATLLDKDTFCEDVRSTPIFVPAEGHSDRAGRTSSGPAFEDRSAPASTVSRSSTIHVNNLENCYTKKNGTDKHESMVKDSEV